MYAPTTKPAILSYVLELLNTEGRPIFTTAELAEHFNRTQSNIRSDLRRYRSSGYVRSYESPIVRCGSMKCVMRNTIWTLTRKGFRYASDRVLDFEPASGQFLFKSDKQRAFPSSAFIMELE